jgi:hypothetical protein
MCWNAEVSLNTFIYGTIAAIIVLSLNKIPIRSILLVYTVSLIQLMEYFTWKNINNNELVHYLSITGAFILLLQVLLISNNNLKNKEQLFSYIFIFILTIIAFNHNFENKKFHMEKGENGHLKWLWADLPIPLLISGLLLWIYPPIRNKNYISTLFIIITLTISFYYYYKYKTWGSMWCYIGNSFWIFLLIKSIYLSI